MATRRASTARAALIALLGFAAAAPAVAATHASHRGAAANRSHARVAVSAAHAKKARRNPRHNVAPRPNYLPVCSERGYHSHACVKQELAAIRNARRLEHVKHPRMILPSNFAHLSTAEQVFVVTDLERVGRGIRPFRGLTKSLSNIAHASAVSNTDPMLATTTMRTLGIYEYGSIWASDLGPLGADYDWMYNDGYGKSQVNIACPTRGAAGCWGHRENIIGSYSGLPVLIAGAGTSTPAGRSVTELLAGSSGKTPQFTYTWKNALRHGANGQRITSPAKHHSKHGKARHRKHHRKHH